MKNARKAEHRDERQLYWLIGVYPLGVLVFGLIQVFLLNAPLFCFGCTIMMLSFYILHMQQMISLDQLTRLNNRGQINRFMEQFQYRENARIYAIMLDIDRFKTINDTYGHVEGDRALMVVAAELKAAARFEKSRLFISRYGGDEFVLVTRTSREEDVQNLIRRINLDLEDKVLKDGLRYPLHISAGYSCFHGEGDTPTACLRRADEAMYIEKKKNHVKR